MKYYVLLIWGDIEPELYGPYGTAGERDNQAWTLRTEHGDKHGIYSLDVSDTGEPSVEAYSGGFFE